MIPITAVPTAYKYAVARLPPGLQTDARWRALLLIFTSHTHLRGFLPDYADLENGEFCIDRFNAEIAPHLAQSEQLLVKLAFHLFSPHSPPVNLSDLCALDWDNSELAISAIRLIIFS